MNRAMVFAAFVVVAMFASAAVGEPIPDFQCNVCTCANEEILCLQQTSVEEPQEGVCGPACSGIGSSFSSIETFQTSCLEVLACNGDIRSTPAAGPMWLSAAALGMALFGGFALRRSRTPRA